MHLGRLLRVSVNVNDLQLPEKTGSRQQDIRWRLEEETMRQDALNSTPNVHVGCSKMMHRKRVRRIQDKKVSSLFKYLTEISAL